MPDARIDELLNEYRERVIPPKKAMRKR